MSDFEQKVEPPDNQCPGCGNLNTFQGGGIGGWVYYCHDCKWGFGHPQQPRNIEKEKHD